MAPRISFSTLHLAAIVLWLGALLTLFDAIEAGAAARWGWALFYVVAALGGLFLGRDVWRAA